MSKILEDVNRAAAEFVKNGHKPDAAIFRLTTLDGNLKKDLRDAIVRDAAQDISRSKEFRSLASELMRDLMKEEGFKEKLVGALASSIAEGIFYRLENPPY